MQEMINKTARFIAIDHNNNVTISSNTRKKLLVNLLCLNHDESENSHKRIKRIIEYDIYMIPKDFIHINCPCIIPKVKQYGTKIETGGIKVTLYAYGCTAKQHDWRLTFQDDHVNNYRCINCNRGKVIFTFDDCPLCHKEIQPVIRIKE